MEFTSRIRGKYLVREYKKLINKNDKVLDVGSGDSYISRMIQEEIGCEIIGLDTLEYPKSYIPLKKYDGNRFPFEDNEFDVVMFNGVIHHISNQLDVLKEARRVTKKKVFLFDQDITKFKDRFFSYTLEFISLTHNPLMKLPFNFRTKNEFLELFKLVDLKVNKIIYPKTSFIYPLKHILFDLKK